MLLRQIAKCVLEGEKRDEGREKSAIQIGDTRVGSRVGLTSVLARGTSNGSRE